MPLHYRKKNVNAYMEDKGSSIESNQFVLSLLILTDYTPRSKEVICEADLVVGRSLDRSLPPLGLSNKVGACLSASSFPRYLQIKENSSKITGVFNNIVETKIKLLGFIREPVLTRSLIA